MAFHTIIFALINLNAEANIGSRAFSSYNQVLAQKTQTSADLVESGIAKSELKNPRGAIADFTKAIQISPNLPDAYALRATERQTLGDLNGAIADLNQLIKIRPNVAESYSARAQIKYALGDKLGAIADYTKALKLIPNDPEFQYQLGKVKSEMGKIKSELGDTKGAIAEFNQAIKNYPLNSEAYQGRGELRSKLGDQKGAIADFNQARQIEAKTYVSCINRYSVAYVIEQKVVAPSLETLKIEDKPKNNTYSYAYQKINQTTTLVTALSTQSNLKTYIGTTVSTDEKTTQSIICETNQKTNLYNLIPKINNSQLICPVGSVSAF